MMPTSIRIAALVSVVMAGCALTASAQIPAARRINWQPGVQGGIPTRGTVCANVANFGAVGNGVQDDGPAIQNAIDACAVGQVVFIPAGTYRLNRQLQISKAITLRGVGPSATRLLTYANWHGIQLGDFPAAPAPISVAGSPAKDATTITVASISGLAVNDYISIDQVNDNVEVVNADGTGGSSPEECRSGAGTRCIGQITRIAAINGSTLTVAPALYHAYSAAQSPQIWKLSSVTRQAGVEDLSLERISPTGFEGYHNFKVVACAQCWIKNVASIKTATFHVDLDRTVECEIRDSLFSDGWAHGGGRSYGVAPSGRTSAALIENNIFYHLRHAMIVKDGAAGNVFGYNYSVASYQGEDWLAADMNSHGAHTTMNLFEGNIAAKIYGDFTHGSSSYNSFFRNWVVRTSSALNVTRALRAVDIEKSNWYYNVVGNVLGQAGQTWTAREDNGSRSPTDGRYAYTFGYFSDGTSTSVDSQSKATAFRHGNFDYATQSTLWDASTADRTLPASLYLTSKPAFFGGLPWPSIGPDLTPLTGTIPAKERYEGRPIPGSIQPPQPATNVRLLGD